MRREHDSTKLRRYVLGALTEDERAGIEREYFEHADVLDQVCAAEDDLIDDYLSDRLASDEHERFEQYYLALPRHRTRVGVARALRTASSVSASASNERHERVMSWWKAIRAWPSLGPAALVGAALAVLVAGGVWMLRERSESTPVSVRTSPPSVSPTTSPEPRPPDRREPAAPSQRDREPARATPVVVAVSLSPIHVRGADEPARLTIAAGTDVVRLQLQGETGEPRLERGRAIVRTVAGQEVWRGRAAGVADPQRSVLAHIDIPAARLRPDDYIVELLDVNAGIREAERYRYFFRVRSEQKKNMP